MLNRKGSTLIESLFALEIFITILVVYVGLFQTIFKQELRIKTNVQTIMEKERDVTYQADFTALIEMALR